MSNSPTCYPEARRHRYGRWEGNPRGNAYDPHFCAAEIDERDGYFAGQCSRSPGKGRDGIFCGGHAKKYPAIERKVEHAQGT